MCVCVCVTLMSARVYLGGQQPGEVDLGHHLAAAVALPLVRVVVVLHQVPQLGAALQVGGDHWGARAQAVGAASRAQHALCSGRRRRRKGGRRGQVQWVVFDG